MTIKLAAMALSIAFTAAPHRDHKAPVKHRPGCNTRRCDRAADHAYQRHLERLRRRLEAKRAREGRLAVASYFGGGSGACGGGSWGVANKTLPCGTRLTICAATCASVTVTDRGPYSGDREFDLTEDVAKAIGAAPWQGGFSMSAGVGTVRVVGG